MATKSLLKSGNIRVQIRVKEIPSLSRTFPGHAEANAYIERIESDIKIINESTGQRYIDMARVYAELHPDLKDRYRRHGVFAKALDQIQKVDRTIGDLIDAFVIDYNKKDQNIVHRLCWWARYFGHYQVAEFTAAHVREGVAQLMAVGSTGNKPVSPQTTNRFKANLSSVFKKGGISPNPCRDVASQPEGGGRERFLLPEQQQRLVQAARFSEWPKLYAIILLALTSGARRGELAKLRWNDVDLKDSTAICRDTKNGSDKVLYLTDAVITELRLFKEVGSGLVFNNPRKLNRPYGFRKEWGQCLIDAGIPELDEYGEKLVFHSLRHSFCSTLGNQGKELQEIASLAGHKSLQTTMRYLHLGSERKKRVLDDVFSSLG